MAWKEDTFWEKHPQPTSPPACWHWKPAPRVRQGLRLKSRFCIPGDGLFTFSLLFFMILHRIVPELFEPWLHVATFPAFLLSWNAFCNSLIPSLLSRYYIFDAMAKSFVSRVPTNRYSTLIRVASDPTLLSHLGPTDWRRVPFDLAWSSLYGKFGIFASSGFLLLGGLAAAVAGEINVNWCVNMTLVSATATFVFLMYHRLAPSRPGRDFEGRGEPPDDSDRIPYERVTTATLRWDRLLQREYLLLEHDGGALRYYNFTGDPLYLLRLWKRRMPGSVLTVENRAGGTS